jgi:hypothetical protein
LYLKIQQEPNPGIPSPQHKELFLISRILQKHKVGWVLFIIYFFKKKLAPLLFYWNKGVLYANCKIPEIK